MGIIPGTDDDVLRDVLSLILSSPEGSIGVDAEVCRALGGMKSGHLWRNPFEAGWRGIPNEVSTSMDAASRLFRRVYPDTEDLRFNLTIWEGARPAARISYEIRDEGAEGGWAIGVINNLTVRGNTSALAITAAIISGLVEDIGPTQWKAHLAMLKQGAAGGA